MNMPAAKLAMGPLRVTQRVLRRMGPLDCREAPSLELKAMTPPTGRR